MKRKSLTQWQILVIDQLLNRAIEFETHKYDKASLINLVEIWNNAATVTVTAK